MRANTHGVNLARILDDRIKASKTKALGELTSFLKCSDSSLDFKKSAQRILTIAI